MAKPRPRKVCTGKGRARRCTTVTPAPAPAPAPEPTATPAPAPVASSSAPAGPSGGDPGAFAFFFPNEGRPGRFNPCEVVRYRVNAHRAPAGGEADLAEALSRVSAATGLTFAYEGRTDEMPQSSGGRYTGSTTIVAWANPGESNLLRAGAAGVGGASAVISADGAIRITRGFVVLDATQPTSAGFGGGFSQGALLLHELGHMVGLQHVGDPAQIMYPTLTSGAPGDWGNGDRNGLAAVGAGNGCLA
ncbi:MAG: matrixin family metalloprotease [Actinobacteria bacterium]|nr:matrixin family metalloprotease [Actinomycetota bacterium]